MTDATLIRRAGLLERLAKSLYNEARQGVSNTHDRERVLEILHKAQKIVDATTLSVEADVV